MPNGPSKLPQITKFLAGLITNRSPIDTPISRIGLQTIEHHDALIDGFNMEVSVFNTLQKRPGYTTAATFTPIPAEGVNDFWSYKDLTGALSYFYQAVSRALFQGSTQIVAAAGVNYPWSVQGRGNFVYVSAGDANQFRLTNTALTTPTQMGITPPNTPLSISFQPLFYYSVVSDFIPATDNLNGTMFVTDEANNRSMTITVTGGNVHFNITYTGVVTNPTNQSYTETTLQSVVGSTTTDVVTIVNGYQDTITGTGISNGVAEWYPSTATATLDFDYATSAVTMSVLVAAIHAVYALTPSGFSNVPANIAEYLKVFMDASLVNGLLSPVGQTPIAANVGVAMNMLTVSGFVANELEVTSSLQDTSNPQYPVRVAVGSVPRIYTYQSPVANVTDTLTGSFVLKVVGASTVSHTLAFSNQTLQQITASINTAFGGVGLVAIYIQTGTTAYVVIRSVAATNPSTTQDVVVTLESNTLVNNNDTNEDYTHWIYTSNNDWAQLPQQEIQLSYALRDTLSGGLSNVAPAVTIGPQLSPIRWVYTYPGGTLPAGYAVELYRTVDGGSSYLYEQNLITSTMVLTVLDSGLNTQLLGPIDEVNDPPPRGLRNIVYHTDRLFGIVDDRVYYSGGPDTVNGNGDESWPPDNYFQYPGSLVDIKSTTFGLIVSTSADLYRVSGVDSSSYYSQPWLRGFGIPSNTSWDYDGQSLYVFTSRLQLHALTLNSGKEIGFPVGDLLLRLNNPGISFHRASALDTALYISGNGGTLRYDPIRQIWSTLATLSNRLKSLETTNNGYLLFRGITSAPSVSYRDLTSNQDYGVPYTCFATIGVMAVAPLGTHTALETISGYFTAVGSVPTISVLLNEISATTAVPFLQLFNPINEPVNGRPPQTIYAKRWSLRQTIESFPDGWGLINLISVKIAFPAEDYKNEILGIFLRDTI